MSYQPGKSQVSNTFWYFWVFDSSFYFSSASFAVSWHYLLSAGSRMSVVCLRVAKTAGSANGVASGTTILALIRTVASHRSQDWGAEIEADKLIETF